MRYLTRFTLLTVLASAVALGVASPIGLLGKADAKPEEAVRTWRISFELAFGDSSPYARQFKPGLYDVPYLTSYRVTQTVLPEIAARAQTMAGLKSVGFYMGPGGYQKYVSPSGQFLVKGTAGQVRLAIGLIGYLAQQTEVIASTDDPTGDVPVLDIVGFHSTSPQVLGRVHADWLRLNARSPKLAGFLPLPGAKGGFRIIDSTHSWTARDLASFDYHVDSAMKGRPEVHTKRAVVRMLSSKNDWSKKPSGEAYLADLRAMDRSDLVDRVKKLNAKIQNTIKAAYRRYVPVSNPLRTQVGG